MTTEYAADASVRALIAAVDTATTRLLSDPRGQSGAAGVVHLEDAHTAAFSLAAISNDPAASALASRVAEARFEAESALLDLDSVEFDAALAELPAHTWGWQSKVRGMHGTHLQVAAERHLAMRDHLRTAVETAIDRRTHHIYAGADAARTAKQWLTNARTTLGACRVDAGRLLEAIIQDRVYCEAERGAASLTELSDALTGIDLLLRLGLAPRSLTGGAMALYRRSSASPATAAIELFVPMQFLGAGGPTVGPADLLTSGALASLVADIDTVAGPDILRQRVTAVKDAEFPALTYDMGSFADPFWYVHERGSAHDLLALVHEIGHVLTGRSVRQAVAGAWRGLLPDVLDETLAYTLELHVATHDPRLRAAGALRESLRHLAANALAVAFTDELYRLIVDGSDRGAAASGDGTLASQAWEVACGSLGLAAGPPECVEWLLVPGIGSNQNLGRLNLAAQTLAVGAMDRDPARSTAGFHRLLDAWQDQAAFAGAASELCGAAVERLTDAQERQAIGEGEEPW